MKTRNTLILLATIIAGFVALRATQAQAQNQMIGINVLLK